MRNTQSVVGDAQRRANLVPTLEAQANWDLEATEKKKNEMEPIRRSNSAHP